MSYFARARTEDVRALVGAIVLGSGAGLLVGGAFLATGSPAKPPTPAVLTPTSTVQASIAPVSGSAQPIQATSRPAERFLASLRGRFQFPDPTHPAARPFQFPQVADARTDLQCLTEAVYFEARGEEKAGQQAVAQVVLNRVRHPAFPKTVCGVVHQRTGGGCQFSFACSVKNEDPKDNPAWRRAQGVAQAALHGAVMSAVGDATHFQTARSGAFAGLLKVAQIGAHIFYRFGGHAGSSDMFRQTPAPSTTARIELAKADAPAAKLAQAAPAQPEAAKAVLGKPAPARAADRSAVALPAVDTGRPAVVAVRLVTTSTETKALAVPARSPPAPAAAPAGTPTPLPAATSRPIVETVALAQG